jgi:predicted NBD/HSP70 family sugar kinase
VSWSLRLAELLLVIDALPVSATASMSPGWVDSARGVIIRATTLAQSNIALQSLWETPFSLPVMVENKVRAAAMAEALHGTA